MAEEERKTEPVQAENGPESMDAPVPEPPRKKTAAKPRRSTARGAKKTKSATGTDSEACAPAPNAFPAEKSGETEKEDATARTAREADIKETDPQADERNKTPKEGNGSSLNEGAKAALSDEEEKGPSKEEPAQTHTRTEEAGQLPPPTEGGALTESKEVSVVNAVPPVAFPEKEARKNFFGRLLTLFLLAAVLFASVLIFLFRPALYIERTNAVGFFYNPADNTTVVTINGTRRGAPAGQLDAYSYNERGSVCLATIGGQLYYIHGRKVEKIAGEDDPVLDFALASSGRAAAYRTQSGKLYRIDLRKNKTECVTRALYEAYYCISPDGRELAYSYRDGDSVLLSIESLSGKGMSVLPAKQRGLLPLAVADKCNYLYYTDESGALYVQSRKGEMPVKCGDAPDLLSLSFNRDFSELIFGNDGATIFVSGGNTRPVEGSKSGDVLSLLENKRVEIRALSCGKQYLLRSFTKNYYLQESGTSQKLVYIDRHYRLSDICFVDSRESITVTDKAVYFLLTDQLEESETHSNLYRLSVGKTDKDDLFRIAWDVKQYTANLDGSRVLYADKQQKLYVWRKGQVALRLCEVMPDTPLLSSADDLFLFFGEDGTLYLSENGDEPRAADVSGVRFAVVDGHTVYYYTEISEEGIRTVHGNYRAHRRSKLIGNGLLVLS